MSVCLTYDEIVEITGKVQPAAQLRELQRIGIRAYRRKDAEGSVCVVREWLASRPAPAAESRPVVRSQRRKAA